MLIRAKISVRFLSEALRYGGAILFSDTVHRNEVRLDAATEARGGSLFSFVGAADTAARYSRGKME
jgi:hypothetical protein